MIDDAEAAPAETQIRQALKGRVDALRSKDVARLLSHYAPDVRVFSLAPPLQRLGADTLGEAMTLAWQNAASKGAAKRSKRQR